MYSCLFAEATTKALYSHENANLIAMHIFISFITIGAQCMLAPVAYTWDQDALASTLDLQ